MSTLKVNAIRGTGASSDAITVNATDGSCTAKITNNLSNRNLIINGAVNVAQRGTSSTSTGYATVDRMNWGLSGHSVTVTQSQHALTSSDTGPWEKGFRNSAHIALSGAGTMATGTTMSMFYKVEAQDIANSGWDYTNTSSNITVSFWLKVSTVQTFYLLLFTSDGTSKSIVKEVTPADTNWNKFTFTIPGHADLQFDNNSDVGLSCALIVTYGTDKTGSGNNLNSWGNYNSSERVPDMASTWLTAGASTYEFTGLQLEVGDVATDFEHRSFGDELWRCRRYCQASKADDNDFLFGPGYEGGSGSFYMPVMLNPPMRGSPSMTIVSGDWKQVGQAGQSTNYTGAMAAYDPQPGPIYTSLLFWKDTDYPGSKDGRTQWMRADSDGTVVALEAEL
tara:strand:+ start:2059 stop:3237 length:1179 start_codon:yes stop_codon:yes gene_type:complete